MEGNIVSGERKPSIEFDMHRLIYKKREDVNAVIHNHSMNATVAASIKGVDSIPIIDIETVLYLGGNILVAPFAPPGSLELAECVSDYLGTNAAVLMANHGAIGAGDTMKFALLACDNLERTCQMFLALHSCGELKEMPSAYIESAKVKSFGKRGLKLTKK